MPDEAFKCVQKATTIDLERQNLCPEVVTPCSQANADLQKVAHEKVASMRAERDALAAEVAAARRQLAERQDDSEQVSRTCTAVFRVAALQRRVPAVQYYAQHSRSSRKISVTSSYRR